jgi:light-harvesting complex II chlorophyll a/b binding protein 4
MTVNETYDTGLSPAEVVAAPEGVAATTSVEDARVSKLGVPWWNPLSLDISKVPGPIKSQFVPDYLKAIPAYLDGSMAGDQGFDPLGLVALASPTEATDKFARTAKDRDAKMLSLTPEEQNQALAWMRESEIKHARLAMLGAAGWPLSELNSEFSLKNIGTNGRAPSLFNGHLLDFWPFLLAIFGPIAILEFLKKDSLPQGDYSFDPMGLAGDQKPDGAWPLEDVFAKAWAKWTQFDPVKVRYGKDLEAMKLAEIKNGRLAMMAITGMAVQEFVYGTPVVEQSPFFFGLK